MSQRLPDEAFYNPNPNPYPTFNNQPFGYNNAQTVHTENQYGDHFTEFLDAIKHQNYPLFIQLLRENPTFATRVDITSRQPPMFHVVVIPNEDLAIQMIRDLMSHGADPGTKDPLRQNPMSYVARDGRNKIFDFLSSVGVPSNEIDANQQTPLYYAAREGRYEICRKILEQGANPNHLDLNSQTSLFYAAKMGRLDVCKLLVDYGAKYDQADFKKQTALAYAKMSKNQALIEFFQSLKAGNKPPKEKPEPKAPPKKKVGGSKTKEEPKTTYKLVFLNPSGSKFDVTEDEFERFRRTHPELADYLMHPEKIPPEDQSEKKKDKWEKVAKKLITALWKYKDSYIFHEPVDPVKLNCLDYFQIIKSPMDFGTIKNRLNSGYYKKMQEVLDDIVLVFRNCYVYNGTGSAVGKIGLSVEGEYQKLYKTLNIDQILLDEQKGGNLTEHGDHESMQSFPQDLLDEDFAAHDMFNLSETGS